MGCPPEARAGSRPGTLQAVRSPRSRSPRSPSRRPRRAGTSAESPSPYS
ncbi:hypothetical protein [Ornithinimicrobium kibberense]